VCKTLIQQPINPTIDPIMATTVQEGSGAVLTQLKTIFYSIYCFYITENDKRYSNIVKKRQLRLLSHKKIPLYFNAIDIPLLHTKIRKVAIKFERNIL
jgi:hypothetical protein